MPKKRRPKQPRVDVPSLETRQEIVLNACRWCCNILIEVQSNHGACLPSEARALLREAVARLIDVPHAVARAPLRIPQETLRGVSTLFGAMPDLLEEK